MAPIIEENLEELRGLFRKYKMQKVWLFGSGLDPANFRLDSDIDFLYEPDKKQMSIREFLDYPILLKKRTFDFAVA